MEETKKMRFSDTEKGSMERVSIERECFRCTDMLCMKYKN